MSDTPLGAAENTILAVKVSKSLGENAISPKLCLQEFLLPTRLSGIGDTKPMVFIHLSAFGLL